MAAFANARSAIFSALGRPVAIISVINDLATDNRVRRTAGVLAQKGYDVRMIGRLLPHSLPVPKGDFRPIRMRMLFRSGPAFYLFFNLRLFLRLLFSRAGLLFANDLDTLAPNYVVSKLRGIPLVYDSHELFTEVPELQHTPFKRKLWEKLEAAIVPRLKTCITVNESIAAIFEKKYHVKFHAVRNIPDKPESLNRKSRAELGLPSDRKIIILQGAGINVGRGAEELVEAMQWVNGAVLVIIGGGDVWPLIEKKVTALNLAGRVMLKQKMPATHLADYTANADLGISIDKPTNRNYLFSLPNKLFDYIHAGLPVLCSRLPEIERIVNEYQVGGFIDNHQPAHIAQRISEMLVSPMLAVFRRNAIRAASELIWGVEKRRLAALIPSTHGEKNP